MQIRSKAEVSDKNSVWSRIEITHRINIKETDFILPLSLARSVLTAIFQVDLG